MHNIKHKKQKCWEDYNHDNDKQMNVISKLVLNIDLLGYNNRECTY